MTFSRAGLHAALLALALLAAQALGLAHRVAHGQPHASVCAATAAPASAATEASVAAAACAASIDRAEAPAAHFADHDPGGAKCRLLDQATHAVALAATAWPALPPRVPAPLPAAAGTVMAGVAVHPYLARGPPAGMRAGPRAA